MNNKDRDNITSLVASLYKPSLIERQLKARFWTMWMEGPSKGDASIEAAVALLNEPAIERKAENPAFVSWFLNKFEAVERLHYLGQVGLDVTAEIMLDKDARPGDRLKAVSLINDLLKASAPKTEVRYADDSINRMDAAEIEELIKKLQ